MFSWLFPGRRRRKLLAEAVPDAWRQIVAQNVGVFALLPAAQQQRLLSLSRVIAAERRWVGCQGLEITDEIRATVAAQAALLLLGVDGYYFDKLPSILIYPGTFVRPHAAGKAIVDEEAGALGESWQGGSIVLSWQSALEGGRQPHDGHNVVVHEFAHHLDSLDGEAGGHPPQSSREAAAKWDRVVDIEYGKLLRALADGEQTLLDPYAAENKAEFFAVASEVFFELPAEMAERHPQLFEILRDFYQLDPASWSRSAEQATLKPRHAHPRTGTRPPATQVGRRGELPPLKRAEEYFTRGWDAYLDGRFEEADADFSEVIRRKPRDLDALVHRAECRLALGRLEEALADAERACQLEPDDAESLRIRGMCRAALGDSDGALADLDRAMDEGAGDGDSHFYRGLALTDLARWREAVADFTAAIAADPADAEAWLERSCCHEALGDEQAARRDRQAALEIEPTLGVDEGPPAADENSGR